MIPILSIPDSTRARAAATMHKCSWEEPPHIAGEGRWPGGATPLQGKEQWLCFAEAAVKRYPTSKVRENQVRR